MQGSGSGVAKAFIVFAVGMLLGFGLCASALGSHDNAQGLLALGVFVFFGSMLGMIVTAIIVVVRIVLGGSRRP